MLVPEAPAQAATEIKGSRFLAYVRKINHIDRAKDITTQIGEEHPGASHIVYAFVIGKKGEQLGMSDDREPKGSAGRPLLDVLRGYDITNTIVIVVRYFGGTKLGVGGLSRAYKEAGKKALKKTKLVEFIEYLSFLLVLPYEIYEPGRDILLSKGCSIRHEDFKGEVEIIGKIPQKKAEETAVMIKNLSKGNSKLEIYQ